MSEVFSQSPIPWRQLIPNNQLTHTRTLASTKQPEATKHSLPRLLTPPIPKRAREPPPPSKPANRCTHQAGTTSYSVLVLCWRFELHHVAQLVIGQLFLPLVVKDFRQFVETEHGFHSVREQRMVVGDLTGSPVRGSVRIEV